jgi:hypothetical protein
MNTTRRYIMLSLLILLIIPLFSCNDSNNDNSNLTSTATVQWTGDYAVDGCGFFVIIDGHKYKPENESIIDSSFSASFESTVIVEYELLNKKIGSSCGDLPYPTLTDGIKIISIKKK